MKHGGRGRLTLGLMVASGFCGLSYQIVWTQQSAIWLGHESAAILAVVAAFFGGLAVGALTFGARVDRSANPALWYAGCEAIIGLWSVTLVFLMAPVASVLLDLIGAQPAPLWHWSVAFCGTFALLLPATAAMGATLPAMERVTARLQRHGSSIAALYAGNTVGAVVGVLTAAFWLVPAYGLTRTALACAALNLACAALTVALFRDLRTPAAPGCSAKGSDPFSEHYVLGCFTKGSDPSVKQRSGSRAGLLWLLGATGLLGIGYEVVIVRVLSQVAENTVYTFAMLLAVYLGGTALGAAVYQRRQARGIAMQREPHRLLCALTAASLLGAASLWVADAVKAQLLHIFGRSMTAAVGSEAGLAIAAFLLPTMVMGALFSHLAAQARAAGIGFGRSLGVNTLGAAAAPALFGVVLVPLIGAKLVLLFIVAGYLALSARAAQFAPAAWGATAAGLALTFAFAPPLAFVDVPEGGRIVSYREGVLAAVSVVEDADGVARLHIDNRQQEGSSATLTADARQALLPLLLHPRPRRALFLGLGTGVTASSAAEDRQLRVDVVELLPEVIDASEYFTRSTEDARLHIIAADARRYIRAAGQRYDLIVSDNFHPARSGSGALYTVEHFRAVRGRLAPDGLFCQWLPLHQLDLETLRSIVRAFITAYPHGWALLATLSLETPVLGLLANESARKFDIDATRARIASAALPRRPAEFGIDNELALLGSFVAGPRALARFAGAADTNTDDHPVVAYRAPRITYAADSLPKDRLIALLHHVDVTPDELIEAPPGPDAWSSRLLAYWHARNHYLEVGRDVRLSADPERMLSQVREPLLDVLRTSPDFRPAYDPLLQLALALASTDPTAARALLIDLQTVQPARTEASVALSEIADR